MIYELIIDGRNSIEHSYTGATEKQARHAVELAEIAISTLVEEANFGATINPLPEL